MSVKIPLTCDSFERFGVFHSVTLLIFLLLHTLCPSVALGCRNVCRCVWVKRAGSLLLLNHCMPDLSTPLYGCFLFLFFMHAFFELLCFFPVIMVNLENRLNKLTFCSIF
ncbi:unnamed protein product, partial [Choristocarpus tenellus]